MLDILDFHKIKIVHAKSEFLKNTDVLGTSIFVSTLVLSRQH